MWGESSKKCEYNCQCSGLITDSFKINSGNSATKRKQEEALSNNYRLKIHPHTLDFNRAQSPLSSPICTPSKRRVLGELQNSPLFRPKESPTIERLKKTPITKQNAPPIDSVSPLTSRSERKRTKLSKIARILDERSRYRMANKENSPISDTFPKMDHTESEMFLNMDSTEKSMMFSQTSKLESSSLHQSDVFLNRNVKEAHSLKRTNLSMFSKLNKIENESTTDTLFKMNTKEESLMFNKITNTRHSISVFSKSNKGHESLNSTEKFLKSTDDSLLFNKVTNVESNLTTMYSSSKDNELNMSETFVKLDVEEETRDCSFSSFPTSSGMNNWCTAKLDFTDALQSKSFEKEETKNIDSYVPEKEASIDPDFDTLHDLEEEFDCANFDECSKYEIISTDSPNIISSGRTTSRKVHSRNFEFGAPLLENEKSTSFNRPNVNATRMLNFEDEDFEFTSPAVRKHSVSVKKSLKFSERHNVSVKKSLKFTETPTKTVLRHEKSDSSIGSMSTSPASTKLRIFPSESTMSMESGFISELEDPILDFEISNSPKMANFNELICGRINDTFMESRLLSGKINEDNQFKDFGANQSESEIKDSFEENDVSSREIKTTLAESPFFLRRPLQRSLSFNAEALKARASLFSINESPAEKKSNKRNERSETENISSKRRRSNCMSPEVEAEKHQPRPVLQRAFSENNASIMSAMTRFETEPGLIGDFTLPFALPLTSGEHTDLNSISCDTLAQLLRGDYKDCISEFQVIDCRYPYEFEGGHIAGAVNLYTPELVQALVEQPRVTSAAPGRRILVFHCEFSRERGPKLSRFLRSRDRAKNKENYPSLHYPEVYLLHEGYRAFYRRYPELCSPAGYTAMLDPGHRLALKRHRSLQPTTGRRNRLLL